MTVLNPDIGETLADICREAGELILPLWETGFTVTHKADKSPVTEADQRAEKLILERLAEHFPGVTVISEEDASEFGTPEAIGPRFFLVDPLDGTKAFVRHDPNFTVNIALVEHGRAVAGAVLAPPTGEVWYASGGRTLKRVGDGAPTPVKVRPWPQGEAIALMSHTTKPEEVERLRAAYNFTHIQAMDSSVKICRVAEGAADIYPRHGRTMEWDVAAAQAVLEGAGGRMTTLEGEPFLYGKASEGFQNGWFVARGGD